MPPSTPAVASKASKVKSKSTKANATNRVRKPAPTHRNTRGANGKSRTASPDYPSPSAQADLEAECARLRRQLKHYRHRSHHPRQRRSGRDDSEDDSPDSDMGDDQRVSFLHHHAGNSKPFLKLHEHYPAVNIKYFKQIYWGTFQPSQSMRLAHDALTWSTTPKRKKDSTPESSNMVQLLRCFEVYGHAICFFAARPHVALQLHEALIRYRIRLMDFSLIYDFDSIRTYHYAFMAKRILSGQDLPVAWLQEDYRCQHYLVPKPSQLQANLPLICSAESGNDTYSPYHVGTEDDSEDDCANIPLICNAESGNECESSP